MLIYQHMPLSLLRLTPLWLGLLTLRGPTAVPPTAERLAARHAPAPAPALSQRVDSVVRAQMARRRIPGLQLAMVQHGRIVKAGSYGWADVQHAVPVTPSTVFTINSMTKAFVGVAVMQLVEDGKLELSAPISRYLPGLPRAWQAVIVRQLLTHTSGLPNIMPDNERFVPEGGEDSAWVAVQARPLEFAPGEQFSYNQTNYFLLGRLIDARAGAPFPQVIARRQLIPAGMRRTERAGFGDSRDVVPHSARGYTFDYRVGHEVRRGDRVRHVFEEFSPGLRTAAGMSATATELARWVIALQHGRLLTRRASLDTLWAPGRLNDGTSHGFGDLLNGYALGWPTVTRPAHPAVAPVGGGRSALFVYPQDDLAVVVLTNLQGASPEAFIDDIAAVYFGAETR